jgi:hypothetical protein
MVDHARPSARHQQLPSEYATVLERVGQQLFGATLVYFRLEKAIFFLIDEESHFLKTKIPIV